MNYFTQYNFFSDDDVGGVIEKLNSISNSDCLCINYGHENYDSPSILENIVKHYNVFKSTGKNFHLIFNQTYKNNLCHECKPISEFIDINDYSIINSDLFNSYLPIFFELQEYNNQYTFNENNVLLQIGKFGEKKRIYMLLSLLKNLPKKLIYSFYPHLFWEKNLEESYYKEIIYHNKNLKKDRVKDFLYNLANHLDLHIPTNGELNNTGYPFQTWPYSQSVISVICETNHPFEKHHDYKGINVTEKTYRTMINNHPFLLVSSPNQIQNLKDDGFYTFEDLFTIKNYNSIEYVRKYEKIHGLYFDNLVKKNLVPFIYKIFNNYELREDIISKCNHNFNKVKETSEKIISDNWFLQSDGDIKRYFNSVYDYKFTYHNGVEYNL